MATIALTSHQESESGMSSAFTSGLLTFVFCLTSVLCYETTQSPKTAAASKIRKVQMSTSLLWVGQTKIESSNNPDTAVDPERTPASTRRKIIGPNIRFSVGITGVNQWYSLAVATLFFPALIFCKSESASLEKKQLNILLAFQTAAMLVFLAMDLVLLVAGLYLMAFFYGFMMQTAVAESPTRDDAQSCGISLVLSSLLILFAVATLVSAVIAIRSGPIGMLGSPSFSIPFITSYLPRKIADDPAAANFWVSMAPWAGLSLLIGLLIRSAAFPFHTWFVHRVVSGSVNPGIIAGLILANSGVYILLTLFMPLFRTEMIALSPYLCMLLSIAAVWIATGTLGEKETRLVHFRIIAVLLQFGLVGVFSMTDVGQVGAVISGISITLVVSFVLLNQLTTTNTNSEQRNLFGGFFRGLPVIGLLPSFIFILIGVSRMNSPSAFWICLLLVASAGISIVGALRHLKIDTTRPSESFTRGNRVGPTTILICQTFLAATFVVLVVCLSFLTSRLAPILVAFGGAG